MKIFQFASALGLLCNRHWIFIRKKIKFCASCRWNLLAVIHSNVSYRVQIEMCVEKLFDRKLSWHFFRGIFSLSLTFEHVKGISKSAPPIKRNPKGFPSSLHNFTSTTILILFFCLNFLFVLAFKISLRYLCVLILTNWFSFDRFTNR